MSAYLTTFIIITILSAYSCFRLALFKERDPWYWATWGLMFGISAIVVLYFLRPLAKKNFTFSRMPIKKSFLSDKEKVFFTLPLNHNIFWYYVDDKNQIHGAMSFQKLCDLWNEKKIQSFTYVWNEKMKDWKKIQELIEQNLTN